MRQLLPSDVTDYLPDELRAKQALEASIRALFTGWGYNEVLPAGVDYFDNYTKGQAARPQESLLKTFDAAGRILVMRPDFTAPIARLAATKLLRQEPPFRLCYVGALYENQSAGAANRLAEYTQAGVELLGPQGVQADAEVALLALDTLREAGLRDCLLELGQVAFFKGLMRETGLSPEATDALRGHLEQKNSLAMELLLRDEKVSGETRRRIMELPTLFGGGEVLQRARALSNDPACVAALDELQGVYDLLCDCGYGEQVNIDLGLVHAIGYYTGLVFRGMTASFGQLLLSGGRYDGLLAEYGRPMPATGFGLGIEHTLAALKRQGSKGEALGIDVVYAVQPGGLASAWPQIQALRAQGLRVELCETLHDASALAQRRGAKLVTQGEGEAT